VFERFVQGETGDRRRFGGIGLGLYIVRQLARAQDGEVAATAGNGGGTRMRVHLRCADAGGAFAAAAPGAAGVVQAAGLVAAELAAAVPVSLITEDPAGQRVPKTR
jgi:hypothetical protein